MAKIVWDSIALNQVHEIYDYYYEHMSPTVAYHLWEALMNAPEALVDAPQIGQIEPLFEKEEPQFRYLVVKKNWKLLYFIVDDICHIALIWDVRNNPMLLEDIAPSLQKQTN